MKHPQQEFIDYVFNFYGKDGIYDMQATKEQIATATNIRLKNLKYVKLPFEADTIDREIVRDILIEKFALNFLESNYVLNEKGIDKKIGLLRVLCESSSSGSL